MEKIKIHFDPTDNSLMIWFDSPQEMAYLSPIEEDTPGDLFLIKNEAGQVIGIECQFFHLRPSSLPLEVETAAMLDRLPHTD